MSDPNPQSRTKTQKKAGGKDALKVGVSNKYLNAAKPFWDDGEGWTGWLTDECPENSVSVLHFTVWSHVDSRGIVQNLEMFVHADRLRHQRAEWARDGMHFWLSRIVEWHGYAIYAAVWKATMKTSEGTEFSRPYGQRIELSDSKRIAAADRAATAAELEWTSRFP